MFTTDSTRLAVQFVPVGEEAWYVAGAARCSYREVPGRPREFAKPITPWRSQFAEKRGYLRGYLLQFARSRDHLDMEIVEVIPSECAIPERR